MLIRVEQLTKRYGHLSALNEVSFSIRSGEILGLIGPNGSGKTTLFECLGGVLPADSGRVSADGRLLTASERAASLFYLPDAIAPWPAQTVRWALSFASGYFASHAHVEHVIGRLGLEPLLDSKIGALSKGQRKRAMLAIGLVTPQPILLADEPFEGLDLRQTRDVAQALRTYADAGRTLVLSIHQISDAARVCDRFVLLSGGRIRGEGTVDELASQADALPGTELEEIFLALT